MLKIPKDVIKEIESVYDDIVVTYKTSSKIDDYEYTIYDVVYNGAKLFTLNVSKIIFKSGRTDIDYTLVTDIEIDCYQTPYIDDFKRNVIRYIKKII